MLHKLKDQGKQTLKFYRDLPIKLYKSLFTPYEYEIRYFAL
ncbi:hypothetical protein D1BOALGB6SA_3880 [Olavius sp. associated proteobacterium Delta 1]|nr:hypothetical protein D1BOALGB6SA_3880 [Olavius sp. associated proteobacterium Delta 1]